MKTNSAIVISLGFVVIFLFLLLYFFIGPAAFKVYSIAKTDETQVAQRDNYRLHTTPLPEAVVEDLCSSLNLVDISEHCKPGVVVYAPDLFDEVKMYFEALPKEERTYDTVEHRLGKYLAFCSPPEPDGYFRCRYDFRGDRVYPVFFDFDNKGFYWQIIANTGADT